MNHEVRVMHRLTESYMAPVKRTGRVRDTPILAAIPSPIASALSFNYMVGLGCGVHLIPARPWKRPPARPMRSCSRRIWTGYRPTTAATRPRSIPRWCRMYKTTTFFIFPRLTSRCKHNVSRTEHEQNHQSAVEPRFLIHHILLYGWFLYILKKPSCHRIETTVYHAGIYCPCMKLKQHRIVMMCTIVSSKYPFNDHMVRPLAPYSKFLLHSDRRNPMVSQC